MTNSIKRILFEYKLMVIFLKQYSKLKISKNPSSQTHLQNKFTEILNYFINNLNPLSKYNNFITATILKKYL